MRSERGVCALDAGVPWTNEGGGRVVSMCKTVTNNNKIALCIAGEGGWLVIGVCRLHEVHTCRHWVANGRRPSLKFGKSDNERLAAEPPSKVRWSGGGGSAPPTRAGPLPSGHVSLKTVEGGSAIRLTKAGAARSPMPGVRYAVEARVTRPMSRLMRANPTGCEGFSL
jgi:hypothetical protein